MGAETPVESPAKALVQGDKIRFFTGTNLELPEEAPSSS
jgi:hypothetical protein